MSKFSKWRISCCALKFKQKQREHSMTLRNRLNHFRARFERLASKPNAKNFKIYAKWRFTTCSTKKCILNRDAYLNGCVVKREVTVLKQEQRHSLAQRLQWIAAAPVELRIVHPRVEKVQLNEGGDLFRFGLLKATLWIECFTGICQQSCTHKVERNEPKWVRIVATLASFLSIKMEYCCFSRCKLPKF